MTETTLGEAVRDGGGFVQTGPFGSQLHAADYSVIGTPVVMPQDITHDRIDTERIARVSPEHVQRLKRHKLLEGDIVFSRRGDVRRRALVTQASQGWLCGTGCLFCRPGNREKIDPKYLYYYLGQLHIGDWIAARAIGATLPNLNTSILDAVPLDLPPIDEQRRIASIIGALDDKIELNRQMNKTLEELARAIFKSWFVDFDPVHAKARGERPIGMDDATAALFPSDLDRCAFIDRRVGWEAIALGRVIEIVGGSTPSTKEPRFWDGQIAFATPRDMSKLHSPFMLATERQVTLSGAEKISSGVLPPGTLLMSSRAPIGYLAFATTDLCVNQGIVAMLPSDRTPLSFMWCWLQTNMDQVISRANGSTFLEISKSAFRSMTVELPPPEILSAFSRQVQPMLNLIRSNAEQNICLARMRDLLLPSLLNGQLL